MKTHDFWYDLPDELIAQTPLEQRDTSRLLVLDRGEIVEFGDTRKILSAPQSPTATRLLMNYYNEVYTILLEQAQRQTSARLPLDESVLAELKRRISAAIGGAPVAVTVKDEGRILEIRIHVLGAEIADNLFTPEAGNLDAFVAREIVRMHDAACGYPGLRLYVENNEIIITLWKNSRLLSSKMFSWN